MLSSASGRTAWQRRLALATVLAAGAVIPSAVTLSPHGCGPLRCESGGTVRWVRPLPGSWLARPGADGTVPAQGEAYAAVGGQIAAVATGLRVQAYQAADGRLRWATVLTGFPAGSAIISLRAWPGVVTAGVAVPTAGGRRRREVVLAAATGRRLHTYPAAPFGGAVSARPGGTVIVGSRAVTSYGRSGAIRWSRPAGPPAQAWQADGDWLYVTVSRGGYASPAPVTALLKINLATGSERVLRPRRGAFAGSLSLAFHGVVLFTGAAGITAYSGSTGHVLWRRPAGLAEGTDPRSSLIYLTAGGGLLGVVPHTGEVETRVEGAAAGSGSGLYGVQGGIVFGLDHGAQGRAWGYDSATQRVVWMSRALPWPHYFVDLSGIGGSTGPRSAEVLLAICARLGTAGPGAAVPCARPELAAVSRSAGPVIPG